MAILLETNMVCFCSPVVTCLATRYFIQQHPNKGTSTVVNANRKKFISLVDRDQRYTFGELSNKFGETYFY